MEKKMHAKPVLSVLVPILAMLLQACTVENKLGGSGEDLDDYFKTVFTAGEPGGAVLVMRNDSVLFAKGYGVADIETGEPITVNTLFNLGSISKTFVANAVLKLEEEGKLSVEDNLSKYFSDFENKTVADAIRIKHLLTHTSGLPDIRRVADDTAYYLTAKDKENWQPIKSTQQLEFIPGSRFKYSNPAYNGLALIIEDVSGMKWQQYVKAHIMAPAGMQASTITDGAYPERGVAHAYVRDQGMWREDDYGEEPTFAAAGNGGVWSTVSELALYEKALAEAKFLKRKTIDRSRSIKQFDEWVAETGDQVEWSWFRPSPGRKPFIGWSWFIGQTPKGFRVIGHTGSQGGFLANYAILPDQKLFFVILCNTPRDINTMSDRIIDWGLAQK